jgi:hypothetical protein
MIYLEMLENYKNFTSELHMLQPNKSLKAFAALTGTVQTGAASHCARRFGTLRALRSTLPLSSALCVSTQ